MIRVKSMAPHSPVGLVWVGAGLGLRLNKLASPSKKLRGSSGLVGSGLVG